MGKIRIVVLDGLEADDVLKLHSGGFFDGKTNQPLPSGVSGQEAVVLRPGDTLTLRGAKVAAEVTKPVAEGYDANAREAVEKAENATPAAAEAPKATRRKGPSVREDAPKVAEQSAAQPATPEQPSAQDAVVEQPSVPQTLADLAAERIAGEAAIEERRKAKLDESLARIEAKQNKEPKVDVAALAMFTKFRDLVQNLLDSGVAPANVAKTCEDIREQVPLLQRIPNIEERVARTLEVMGAA